MNEMVDALRKAVVPRHSMGQRKAIDFGLDVFQVASDPRWCNIARRT